MYRNPSGWIAGLPNINDPKLTKRIDWVLQCINASVFSIQLMDDWKIKKFRVFVRVTRVREYFEVWWSPEEASIFEPHPEMPKGLLDVSWWNWRDVGFGTKTIKAYGYPRDENVYTLIEVPLEH